MLILINPFKHAWLIDPLFPLGVGPGYEANTGTAVCVCVYVCACTHLWEDAEQVHVVSG